MTKCYSRTILHNLGIFRLSETTRITIIMTMSLNWYIDSSLHIEIDILHRK